MSANSTSQSPEQNPNPAGQAPQRGPLFPAWAWLAAAALALITGYSIRQVTNQSAQLATLRQQMRIATMQNRALQDQMEVSRQVTVIMMSPESTQFKLIPKDAKLPALHAYLHPHMGLAISGGQLPAISSERTLQLWFIPKKGLPRGIAIFRPDAQGQVALLVPIAMPQSQVAALAVSEENAGGSSGLTATPGWIAQLP